MTPAGVCLSETTGGQDGGLLTTTSSGYPDQTLKLEAGDFAIQNGGATRALRNSGKEIIELVELELK